MHRAVAAVGNIRERLVHRTSTVYTKQNRMDSFYKKITYDSTASVSQFDDEIIEQLNREKEMSENFVYVVEQ